MKKKYIKPEIEILTMDTCELLSGSSEHNHGHAYGHEVACEHRATKWFCDGD